MGGAPGRLPSGQVGVAIITHKARRHLDRCLPSLLRSPLRPRVLVVNSGSGDGTLERAQELGAETLLVPRSNFNHGLTRELARHHLACPVVVMLTPDAYPQGEDFLERLTAPIRAGVAAVAYGRQIARDRAGVIERFGRAFNYPEHSHLRGLEDWPRYGSYTHFCSNACAAWSNPALDAIGGFPATLVSEETIAAARLLQRGERIAYVAEAVVQHSHDYGLIDEFRRHFDIGWSRRRFAADLVSREGDAPRGRAFARALLVRVAREAPWLLPYLPVLLAAKWAGYAAGWYGTRLPPAIAASLSGQDFFWPGLRRERRQRADGLSAARS
jgi:rhamnosyltransferase